MPPSEPALSPGEGVGPSPLVLILEDDGDRILRFETVLRRLSPLLRWEVWRDSSAMIRDLPPLLPIAALISLDHDLEPHPGSPDDPGDGLQVARFLADQTPTCPVIIHSSNVRRSDWMAGELELAGWTYRTVAPIGEDWIESYWGIVVARILGIEPNGRRRRTIPEGPA